MRNFFKIGLANYWICDIDKTLAWILSSVVYIHDADGDRQRDVLGERRS